MSVSVGSVIRIFPYRRRRLYRSIGLIHPHRGLKVNCESDSRALYSEERGVNPRFEIDCRIWLFDPLLIHLECNNVVRQRDYVIPVLLKRYNYSVDERGSTSHFEQIGIHHCDLIYRY